MSTDRIVPVTASAPDGRGLRWSTVSAVFLHQLRRTRRAWASSLAAGLASPTLFLFALGLGLGSQIDDAQLAQLGVDSYLDYIGPGVLIVTAMQVAATESLWPTMGLLRWQGIYLAILATPITSSELGVAHVLWLAFRAFVAGICFLLVLAVAGAVGSWWALLIGPIAALVAWVHAAPLVAITVSLEQENYFPLIARLIIFPLFLFSGAFFPVDDMPTVIAWFARITPTWHGVELARRLANGVMDLGTLGHVAYLALLAVIGCFALLRQFRKHLEV